MICWQLHSGSYILPVTSHSGSIGHLQGVDGTIELQSAGLPLPDHQLRWLNPLARPLLRVDPTGESRLLRFAADTVMQDTPSPVPSDPAQAPPLAQGVPQPIKQEVTSQQGQQQPQMPNDPQASVSQTSMQGKPQIDVSSDAPSGPSPMQLDSPQHAQHAQTTTPALQSSSNNNHGTQSAGQQQTLAQAVPPLAQAVPPLAQALPPLAQAVTPLQMISFPEGLQELVSASVARCDRQLLGRQEQVVVRLVQQRVAEEVRLVQGAQDMDHPADDLVQRVRVLLSFALFWETCLQEHTC